MKQYTSSPIRPNQAQYSDALLYYSLLAAALDGQVILFYGFHELLEEKKTSEISRSYNKFSLLQPTVKSFEQKRKGSKKFGCK